MVNGEERGASLLHFILRISENDSLVMHYICMRAPTYFDDPLLLLKF